MAQLPSGTVTFLFTDIEGSTRLWDEHPEAMRAALARHDEILHEAVTALGGHVVKTTGDGVHAVFASAYDAVAAAVRAQQVLMEEPWDDPVTLRVRMGLHSGEVELRDGDYFGSATNSAARLMSAAHGGQLVVSGVTAGLVRGLLPPGVELWPLGEHRLRDLAEPISVYQVAAPGLVREFPPLVSLDAFPGNLPAQLSSFVGRDVEGADIAELLREHRLVTLTGVGGVGKTRLALQVAGDVLTRFPDGAWLVELAKVRDPAAVPEAVAAALGAPTRPEVPALDTLIRFLRTKRLLLVLDNCEHLLGAAADVVRSLEQACPDLVVLTTSREGLGIRGERLFAVPSLNEGESQQLFVSRAEAVKHDFVLSDTNLSAVQEVCRRLDGVPLAIELAAARVSALSPSQIGARLDRSFALLSGGGRGAVERHATLRAAIDWSYDLLEADERLTLARLSVFNGGCTLDAAESVCAGDGIETDRTIDLVSSLVTQSLVMVDSTDPDEPWYRLLETIRQYAEEQLDPQDQLATRTRHARYYAAWLPNAQQELQGPLQELWLARCEREAENVRAAITWALEHRDEQVAFGLLEPSTLPPLAFLPIGNFVRPAAEATLEWVRTTSPQRLAWALAFAGFAAAARGDLKRARELLDEAEPFDDHMDDRFTIRLLVVANILALTSGDAIDATRTLTEIASLARRMDWRYALAFTLAGLAARHATSGDFDTARAHATEALEIANNTGTASLITMARSALTYALSGPDPDAARSELRVLAAEARTDRWFDEPALGIMIVCGSQLGEREATLLAALRIVDATPSNRSLLAAMLEGTASVLDAEAPEAAATLRGAVDTITPGSVDLVALRGDSFATESSRAYETGSHMTEDEAIAFARAAIRDALAADSKATTR
jgi:predicted ATPase/class 3 adenylate cyclase